MIDDLITCRLRHFFGPVGNITKVQFNHIPACLTDNMMMVVFCLTEFIFNARAITDSKDNAQGLEEIERPVDRG